MEERNIKVSIVKARDWYNSGNNTLKELALQAFTKEELEIPSISSMIAIILDSRIWNLTMIQKIQLRELRNRNESNISAPKLLRVLALYFNKGWEKTVGNTGYFLAKKEWSSYVGAKNKLDEDWSIIKHESVCYPMPYFKNENDCKKSFEILKGLGKLENLYTDL